MQDKNQPANEQTNSPENGQVILPTTGALSLQTEATQAIIAPQQAAPTNGSQFFASQPTASSPPLEPPSPSKWRYVFIVNGALQAVGVTLFLLVMLWASQQAKAGASGTEFIALILLVTIVPALAILSLISLIGLPIYMRKHRLRGKQLILSVLSLLISAALVLYGLYAIYGLTFYSSKLQKQSIQRAQEADRQFEADNAKPEITKEEAIQLLQSCKLKGLYYTEQTDKRHPAQGGWGELSTTGVVLTKIDGEPYRISIADRLIPELVPIAREAQKTCRGLQFWHDGTYETSIDGKWYFNGEVVNQMQSGKTKEEAISFMQSCKADYFIGYTDINLVKDSGTRSWLDKAEKSTTGIEISENSPASYVFVSKAMTAQLQDTARQFRQSCSKTKKLYISIDNWIETEYPAGKWTRVAQ